MRESQKQYQKRCLTPFLLIGIAIVSYSNCSRLGHHKMQKAPIVSGFYFLLDYSGITFRQNSSFWLPSLYWQIFSAALFGWYFYA